MITILITIKVIIIAMIIITSKSSSFSSLNTGEIRTMDSKNNNLEIMMGSETDDIIKELFNTFLQGYREGLEKK